MNSDPVRTSAMELAGGRERPLDVGFTRGLGLFDSTMVVVGSMVGVGIFIVSAQMARQVGSPGWLLLSWVITTLLTVAAGLSYGELAAMMPFAGGQYVYLREAFSPLAGFLYGWTLFLVIQTGTIAAVAVGFARYLGVLVPWISEERYLVEPIRLSSTYALSLSTTQLVAIATIVLLTWTNTRGLRYGRLVQNLFTTTKIVVVLALVGVVLLIGRSTAALSINFGNPWTVRGAVPVARGLSAATPFGLFIALCVAQTGSLFAADAWNNITFAAGEVKNPRRDIPLALVLGTGIVMALYLLVNIAYLAALPLGAIQSATADRVATAALGHVVPGTSVVFIAIGVLVSSFGCDNGLVLAGARAYYAMARDGVFFRRAGVLNAAKVPGWALVLQGVWSAALVVPRTFDRATGTYGNLYTDLLVYVIAAALIFYILTIAGVFRLRWTRPDATRPYRAFGYPLVPALYIFGACTILIVLFWYQSSTTWPGFLIVLSGVPVYRLWSRRPGTTASPDCPTVVGL